MEEDATLESVVRSVDTADVRSEHEVREMLRSVVNYAAKLSDDVKAGRQREASQDQQIERLTADIKSLKQKAAEAEALAVAPRLDGSSADLRRYIDVDGSVFLRGGGQESRDSKLRRSRVRGLLTDKPVNEAHNDLQRACEALYLTVTVLHGSQGFLGKGRYNPSVVRSTGAAWDAVQTAWKAMPREIQRAWDSQAGTGGEFIPTPLIAEPFWQVQEYDPDGLVGLFREIQLTSDTMELPVGTLYPRPYKGGGASGDNPATLAKSSIGTGKLTLELADLYAMQFVHENASVDSIVAAAPFIIGALLRSVAMAERFTLVNGCKDGSLDALATWDVRGMFGALDAGSIQYLRLYDGLRMLACENSDPADAASNAADRSTFNYNALAEDMSAPGGPKGAPSRSPVVTSHEVFLKSFLTLDEVKNANRRGDSLPTQRGVLSTIAGRPIIGTDAMTADLNASGKYDNTTKDKSGYLSFNADNFVRLTRLGQGVEIAQQPDITVNGTFVRAKARRGFRSLAPSGVKPVRLTYNM